MLKSKILQNISLKFGKSKAMFDPFLVTQALENMCYSIDDFFTKDAESVRFAMIQFCILVKHAPITRMRQEFGNMIASIVSSKVWSIRQLHDFVGELVEIVWRICVVTNHNSTSQVHTRDACRRGRDTTV